MRRRGKYLEFTRDILGHLATVADSQTSDSRTMMKLFRIPKSSASNVFGSMEQDGLITKRGWFNQTLLVKLTEKGKQEYYAKYKDQEYSMPSIVRKYLEQKGRSPEKLLPIQRDFIGRGLIYTTRNVCVFGYPGTGKTLVAEMAIAKALNEVGRVLYCTPYKALDSQKHSEFKQSFGMFPDVKVVTTDGDNPASQEELVTAGIVICTYERIFMAIRAREAWLERITLVIADEITLLAEKSRGGTLDVILTCLKRLPQKPRIITTSSLVGNAVEIAKWFDAEPLIENKPAFALPIEESLVYVRDGKILLQRKNGSTEEIQKEGTIIETIVRNNLQHERTTIIFAGMKPAVEKIARDVAKIHAFDSDLSKLADSKLNELYERSEQARDLCSLIAHGVAYHHAGLQKGLRRFVEQLINEGKLKTIIATTTLSHGIDYKIDSVIVDVTSFNIVRGEGLTMCEYINLKGRTGRLGKSTGADVYVIPGIYDPIEIFNRYFLSYPEKIYPSTTLDAANIESVILSRAEIDANGVSKLLSETFESHHRRLKTIDLQETLNEFMAMGLVKKEDNRMVITEFGNEVRLCHLSVQDAKRFLSCLELNADSLLKIASSIDICKKLALSYDLAENRTSALKLWMKGKSLDSIRSTIGFFYDQEIIELVSYTSLSLWKMQALTKQKEVKRRITNLRKYLRKRMK